MESGIVAVSSDVKLRVAGHPALLEYGISGKEVTGCPIERASDNSGPTALPCKKVSALTQISPPLPQEPPAITSGWATKIKVSGKPVMLETLEGYTDGMALTKQTPQKKLHAKANQDKLKAV
jgi:hypothetical protein